ncbi:twin-arginine translocase TatA/TatE family subunit [Azospirillum humicireducens]|uniref:Sec-independent protein translocase protein TatA n=1 Tax=Azospirillum humicireducens TaxID=1226968 RepID=A0A160JGF3_9PROT|nr:twin-arginine translocase TatA/TatE family subunit [Azospirillum humicireducens]ANC92052.1 twin-arginine translocase TatA/TatE family subunit [Azospirillum humicireducens]
MGSFSIWHWLIVLVIVLLLFGAGKLPSVMGDIAKGVKAFKSGLKDEEEETQAAPAQTAAQAPPAAINPTPAQPAAQPVTQAPVPPTASPTSPTSAQPHPVDPAKPTQG